MLAIVQGLMWIGYNIYGLEEDKLIVKADQKSRNIILQDILASGNLGKYGYFLKSQGKESYIKRSLFYVKRQIMISRVVKSEAFYNLKEMIFHKFSKFAK